MAPTTVNSDISGLMSRFGGAVGWGGVPTRVPGRGIPEEAFLIQADLLSMATFFVPGRPFAAAVFADAGLPTEGVLQLFPTTTGDSLLDPPSPVGAPALSIWQRLNCGCVNRSTLTRSTTP